MITVIIVEDQPDNQYFFKTIINNHPSFNCIGVYSTGKAGIEGILNLKPDVVIMDIGLPDISGVECIRVLKPSLEEVKFMVCSVFEDDEKIFEALKAGANSYIIKKSRAYQITDALLEMYNGDMPVSACIATKLLKYLPQEEKKLDEEKLDEEKGFTITKQEAVILELIAKGYSNQEISKELKVKLTTIKWHIYNIYFKLRAKNRTEALNKYFG